MNLSFIKLDINIMDDTKIKIIRKMPDGSKLFELWIGILCLAMKSSRAGTLEIGQGIPFTDEVLSDHLDIPLKTVRLGLQTFRKFNMIEVWQDGTIFISNFEKHQMLDKIERGKEKTRQRVAKFREKQRISLDVTVTDPLRNNYGNAIEEEEEQEEEQEEEINKLVSYWRSVYGKCLLIEQEFIEELLTKHGYKKTKLLIRTFKERGFNKIPTMRNALDENGNIKPKPSGGQAENGVGYTYEDAIKISKGKLNDWIKQGELWYKK